MSSITHSTLPDAPKSVGAGNGEEAFNNFTRILNWISDTQKKMPNGTTWNVSPAMREEAFNVDPLTSGIIAPFLKNIILSKYSIETEDNKKYEGIIADIKSYLTDILLMDAFRDDFEDYAIKHGHSYRRKDYDGDVVEHLQRLEPRAMKQYEDIWDSRIRAFHQQIKVNPTWSADGQEVEYNNWFVPNNEKYIPTENINDGKDDWEDYKEKYKITEDSNLRVDDANKIIAMDRVKYGTPPAMDKAILAIWLKRLLLANGPNYIFNVLSPFLHIKNGKYLEISDETGKGFTLTTPENPPADMAETDPEKYNAMKAIYNDWVAAMQADTKGIMQYRAEGGVFASGPDKEINVIESGRSISPAFISTMVSLLNDDIGQAFGFPVALIMARGAELATSATIQSIFNTSYAGARIDYQTVADALIKERFSKGSWSYEVIGKDDKTDIGTYTFDEAAPHFKLFTGDVEDALKIAQTDLEILRMLEIAKKLGASQKDIQMLADERGFTNLDLDKFDTDVLDGAGFNSTVSATPPELKGVDVPEEEILKKELVKTYNYARKAITTLLE